MLTHGDINSFMGTVVVEVVVDEVVVVEVVTTSEVDVEVSPPKSRIQPAINITDTNSNASDIKSFLCNINAIITDL
ncbi:MAG: hypothetical protein KAU03_00280 [Candidatus Altiarchaeales archaeon]|nr:hypothetical protein [Candidatus Altiarchaeales archaeon]